MIWVPILCKLRSQYPASYSISQHALAVSTEAWQAISAKACQAMIQYLNTPWKYLPRIGLVSYSISLHSLSVSTDALQAIQYTGYILLEWLAQEVLSSFSS